MSLANGWMNLKSEVIDNDLCCLCGTCIGICPINTLEYNNEYEKVENIKNNCINCGMCIRVCPGIGFDWQKMNKKIFSESIENINLDFGHYKKILKGFATNDNIRKNASSGGVATLISLYLLKNKVIDGVVGIHNSDKKFQPMILKSEEEILESMQSKYIFIPLNETIRYILNNKGSYLYIGLPCEIEGLRKAEEAFPLLKERIYMRVGIFCGFNMSRNATDLLIKKSRINYEDITKLEYRGSLNGISGFKISSKERTFFISKHGYTLLNVFYSKQRCWKCFDLTSEFSDISLGDAWEMGQGWSRLILRTELSQVLMDDLIKNKLINITESKEEDIYLSQKKLINYKKKHISLRKKFLKKFPEYNIDFKKLNLKNNLSAFVFLNSLILGQTKLAHLLLNCIPISIIEKISINLRNKNTIDFQEMFRYIIWGGITVLTSFISYWCLLFIGLNYKDANLISIILTKTAAYLYNKFFVFKSNCETYLLLLKEIGLFIVTRGFSGIIEYVGLILLVNHMNMDKIISKVLIIIITTILNYFFGKKHVFKKEH